MKSINFKHANVQVAKNQAEYRTLPALKLNDKVGTMVTCWKLTFWERVKLLSTGIIWMSEMTFNNPVVPRYFSLNRKECYTLPEDKEYETLKANS